MLVHDRLYGRYNILGARSNAKKKAIAEDLKRVARAINAVDRGESDDLYDEMPEATLRAMRYEVEAS
jgi:hypothetical protein